MKYDCKPLKYFKHNQRVYVPSAQRFGIIKHRYNKILILFDDFGIENSPNWCGAISEETFELVQLQQENERLKKELSLITESKDLIFIGFNNALKMNNTLLKEKQELIEWLKNKRKQSYGDLKIYMIEILNKLEGKE